MFPKCRPVVGVKVNSLFLDCQYYLDIRVFLRRRGTLFAWAQYNTSVPPQWIFHCETIPNPTHEKKLWYGLTDTVTRLTDFKRINYYKSVWVELVIFQRRNFKQIVHWNFLITQNFRRSVVFTNVFCYQIHKSFEGRLGWIQVHPLKPPGRYICPVSSGCKIYPAKGRRDVFSIASYLAQTVYHLNSSVSDTLDK